MSPTDIVTVSSFSSNLIGRQFLWALVHNFYQHASIGWNRLILNPLSPIPFWNRYLFPLTMIQPSLTHRFLLEQTFPFRVIFHQTESHIPFSVTTCAKHVTQSNVLPSSLTYSSFCRRVLVDPTDSRFFVIIYAPSSKSLSQKNSSDRCMNCQCGRRVVYRPYHYYPQPPPLRVGLRLFGRPSEFFFAGGTHASLLTEYSTQLSVNHALSPFLTEWVY